MARGGMIFIKRKLNFREKKFFVVVIHLIFCYYCSINIKRRSEHSGLRPDTSSLVCTFLFSSVELPNLIYAVKVARVANGLRANKRTFLEANNNHRKNLTESENSRSERD